MPLLIGQFDDNRSPILVRFSRSCLFPHHFVLEEGQYVSAYINQWPRLVTSLLNVCWKAVKTWTAKNGTKRIACGREEA